MLQRIFAIAIFTFTVLIINSPAFADGQAKIISVEGSAELKTKSSAVFIKLEPNTEIESGDTLRTASNGRVALQLNGGGIVRLTPNSTFSLKDSPAGDIASLSKGRAFFFSREAKRFPTIQTPAVTAAVRGTEFAVEVAGDTATISVLDGAVHASNQEGSVDLGKNEVAKAIKGQAPQKSVLLNPLDAVQWAIYVPGIDSGKDLKNIRSQNEVGVISDIKRNIERGDLSKADSIAAKLFASSSDTLVKGIAQGYRSIIALAKNDKASSRTLTDEALILATNSETVLAIASLTEQASFDLEAAKQKAKDALALNPANQHASLRLAELELSQGNSEKAENILASLSSSSRRDTLLGFAKLIRYKTDEAKKLFEASLAKDSNSALARLGLGLTLINDGQLEDGRNQLELAAAIEPNTAVYRSYLGKAYFEENRSKLATNEYERAIDLDPNDPTPYLYRAFERLAKNDPVGALEDVEDSIARNNNRAVYRSSLMLDKDNAVRSAGLAEVFTSLGFYRAAQIEAIKSINKDYGNFSAHKLLADSYNTLNTVDALVSEQVISRAYAPLSLNLLGGPQGPASFNDYNAFFDRAQIRQRVGFYGRTSEDALIPYAALAGRTDDTGYRIIAESAFLNGSKDNDYSRDYRFTGTVQHQMTADLRLFAEGKYQHKHTVDQRGLLDDTKIEFQNYVAGFNYEFSNSTKLVGQVNYRDTNSDFYSTSIRPALLDIIYADEAFTFEDELLLRELAKSEVRDTRVSSQIVHDGEYLSLVAGGEGYFGNPDREEDSIILDDSFGLFTNLNRKLNSASDSDLESRDFYLYPTLHIGEKLDLNAGMSYTELELETSDTVPFAEGTTERSSWNPKLGLTAYVTPELTLRAAYFEGLRKSALEDSGTLEPTLVGGFNQVYTDFAGSDSRSYGVGFDYKMSKSTYFGVETVQRDVGVLFNSVDSYLGLDFDQGSLESAAFLSESDVLDYDQEYITAYLYQVLTSRWVASLDYNYFRSELLDPDLSQDISLHKAKGTIRYFDPSGWFAFSELTYRDQNREDSILSDAGTSQFWLIDIGAGYRFTNRQGSVVLRVNNLFDNDFSYDQSLGFEEFVVDERYGELAVNYNF